MAQTAKPGVRVENPLLEYSTTHCSGKKLWGLLAAFSPWDWRLERKRNTDFQAVYLKSEQESNLQSAAQN